MGFFLQHLAPPLVKHYHYIAIVLDDIFLPDQGSRPIHVPRLLEQMEIFNLASISPGIVGSSWTMMNPDMNHHYLDQESTTNCLVKVPMIETFFQIYTNKAWNCLYQFLNYKGGRGWGYDLCFSHYCANHGASLAVDYGMVGYHLEKYQLSNNNNQLDEARKTTNLTFPTKIKRHLRMSFYDKDKAIDRKKEMLIKFKKY